MSDKSLETGLDYVKCPSCGRDVSLTKSGVLRKHQQWTGGTQQFPPLCGHSGKRP